MVHTCLPESSSPLLVPKTFPASSPKSLLVSAKLQAALLAFHASLAGKLHLLVSQLSTCSLTCSQESPSGITVALRGSPHYPSEQWPFLQHTVLDA